MRLGVALKREMRDEFDDSRLVARLALFLSKSLRASGARLSNR